MSNFQIENAQQRPWTQSSTGSFPRKPLSERPASQRNIPPSRSSDVYQAKPSPLKSFSQRFRQTRNDIFDVQNVAQHQIYQDENDVPEPELENVIEEHGDVDQDQRDIAAEEQGIINEDGTSLSSATENPSRRYSIFPAETASKAPRLSLAFTVGRARSRSSASIASYGLFPHLPPEHDPSTAPPVPELPQTRPRSVSSPVLPSENSVLNPEEQQDPAENEDAISRAQSVATTTARAAYPAPRRLQRKRANSQLAQAAAAPPRQLPQARASSNPMGQRFQGPRPGIMATWSGFSARQGAVSPVVEERPSRSGRSSRSTSRQGPRDPYAPPNSGLSQHLYKQSPRRGPPNSYNVPGLATPQSGLSPRPSVLTSNLDEPLYPPSSLKHTNSESRPSTASSTKSGRLSLYKWLNDSYTSWARVYYRNESALHLEVPPNVTEIAEDGTVSHTPNKQIMARLTQSSTSSSGTRMSAWSAAQSVPPTPPVPARYLQAQELPIAGLGYNSPRHASPLRPTEPNGPNNMPPAPRAPRGPPYPQGQPGSMLGPHRPPPGRYGPPPGQYGRLQGQRPPQAPRRGPPSPYGAPPSQQWRSAHNEMSERNGQIPPGRYAPPGSGYGPSANEMLRPSGDTRLTTPSNIGDNINQEPTPSFQSTDNDAYAPGPSDREDAPEANAELEYETDSPGSAGFPQKIYIPRIRPHQQNEELVTPVSDDHGFHAQHQMQQRPSPGVIDDEVSLTDQEYRDLESRHSASAPQNDHRLSDWRSPSYNGSRGVFDTVNRQIMLFCIGFVCPFAWMLAAFLSLPARPEMRQIGADGYYSESRQMTDLFNSTDVVRYQKARRWRVTNRIMSILGICILVIIGACAGVATRH